MMNINPKIVALLILLALVAALTFWTAKEYFESNPPPPDAPIISK